MYSVLVILAVLVAILLIFVVLIQESKGGGLASSFASSNQIMGVRKTTDFVEKATWTLAALLVIFSVMTRFFIPTGNDVDSNVTNMTMPAPTLPAPAKTTPAPAKAPAQPAQSTPAPAQAPAQ